MISTGIRDTLCWQHLLSLLLWVSVQGELAHRHSLQVDLQLQSNSKSRVKSTKFVPSQWSRAKISNPQSKSIEILLSHRSKGLLVKGHNEILPGGSRLTMVADLPIVYTYMIPP